MDFDWSTFILEIVNFLILVWLLKRFLYKPVLDMVERRRASVEKTLQDAEDARDEARRLQEDYAQRNAQWQEELTQRRKSLTGELEAEREKRMQALASELDSERTRRQTREARERESHERVLQAQAARQATRFAATLLGRLSGPELQQRILDVLLDDLAALPDSRVRDLQSAADSAEEILVTSAARLSAHDRQRLQHVLAAQLTGLPALRYAEAPELVAGLRIGMGAWELDASLAGELRAFAESPGHD